MKRDGNTVLSSVSYEMLYDEKCTSRANGVTSQMEINPKLIRQLSESPDTLLEDFEEVRKHSMSNVYVVNIHLRFNVVFYL